MVKRERNKIGQFIPMASVAKSAGLSFEVIMQRAFSILMAIFLFFVVCPWITLAIKSNTIKGWAFSFFNFCNSHFVGINESKKPNGAYEGGKDPNDLY